MSDPAGPAPIFRLAAGPNNYPWGPIGLDSRVARYAPQAAEPGYEVKPDEPYSELWMGTHPTNPSSLYSSDPDPQGKGKGKGERLSAYLRKYPQLLGDAARFPPPFTGNDNDGYGPEAEGHVPFLFKILCAKQALPLQIHPNKDLAAKLHKEDPDNFPDTNHKPEIAVCLSDRFLGFANFRPLPQVLALLRCVPELFPNGLSGSGSDSDSNTNALPTKLTQALRDVSALHVESEAGDTEKALRRAFTALLAPETVQNEAVRRAVRALADRVERDGVEVFMGAAAAAAAAAEEEEHVGERGAGNLVEAVKSCGEFYPGDPAMLGCIIFMNLVELHKGEGMYVGADGVHAWLKGDIVELMATSDNVLNVGFTSPAEVADALPIVARTITAAPTPASTILLRRERFAKCEKGRTTVYAVPFEEFSIMHVDLDGAVGGDGAGDGDGAGEVREAGLELELVRGLTGPGVGIVTRGKITLRARAQSTGTRTAQDGDEASAELAIALELELEEGMVYFIGAGTDVEYAGDGEAWVAFYDSSEETRGQVGGQ